MPLSPLSPGWPTTPRCPEVPAGPGGPSGPWHRNTSWKFVRILLFYGSRRIHFWTFWVFEPCILPEDHPLQSLPSLQRCPLGLEVHSLLDVHWLQILLEFQQDLAFLEHQWARQPQQHPSTDTWRNIWQSNWLCSETLTVMRVCKGKWNPLRSSYSYSKRA